MLCGGLVILLDRWLVDLDTLSLDNCADLDIVRNLTKTFKRSAYPVLKLSKISRAKCVRLCNNRDEVDSRAQTLHDFDIQRLQCVSGRSDEVQACVDTQVNLVYTAWLLLLQHVRFMLVVQEFDDGHPGVSVVHVVSKARGVDDSQADYYTLASQVFDL